MVELRKYLYKDLFYKYIYMTIINEIEIDNITYNENYIKKAIINNKPIEKKLHVIIVLSNPCLYAKRYILLKEFVKRIEMEETNVILYIVELIYKNQKYIITDKNNKNHLQINTDIPLWHKENMINLGVKYLLPKNWKAFAWIDADIEFESTTWALDTLKILNGSYDIVQLFSHCIDMDQNGLALNIFNSFGYLHSKGKKYTNKHQNNYFHPGFAWACNRNAYKKMNGLFEYAILGSGDNIMAFSLIGHGINAINDKSNENYKKIIFDFQEKVKNFRFGYVPGVIKHHFHGSKKNRQYSDRWKILITHDYNPINYITKDNIGVIIPTEQCPKQLLDDIYNYFKERNEDEGLK
jgi:hypothetical protein